MNNQVLFPLKDESKILKCHLLQFLFGALRVNLDHHLGSVYTLISVCTACSDLSILILRIFIKISSFLLFARLFSSVQTTIHSNDLKISRHSFILIYFYLQKAIIREQSANPK